MINEGDAAPPAAENGGDPINQQDKGTKSPDLETTNSGSEKHRPPACANPDQTKNNVRHWLDNVAAICAFLAALGGVGAAGFSAWQAHLIGQTLEVGNRAFVSINLDKADNAIAGGKLAGQNIKFSLVNSGNTPTGRLVIVPADCSTAFMWVSSGRSSDCPIFSK